MRLTILGLVAAFGILAAPLRLEAQPVENVHRIGYLSVGRGVPPGIFLEELRKHGFVEGQNLAIEYRLADGRHDLMRGLAADLVRQNVEAILAMGDEAIVPAMAETKTIPIVMVACDALAVGFVSNLARPGGN